MKTTKSGAKTSATDTSDREHSPLIDAARAIGAAVGKVSSSLGISSPPQTKAQPSKATGTGKGGSRPKAKSGKTAKPAASQKR